MSDQKSGLPKPLHTVHIVLRSHSKALHRTPHTYRHIHRRRISFRRTMARSRRPNDRVPGLSPLLCRSNCHNSRHSCQGRSSSRRRSANKPLPTCPSRNEPGHRHACNPLRHSRTERGHPRHDPSCRPRATMTSNGSRDQGSARASNDHRCPDPCLLGSYDKRVPNMRKRDTPPNLSCRNLRSWSPHSP